MSLEKLTIFNTPSEEKELILSVTYLRNRYDILMNHKGEKIAKLIWKYYEGQFDLWVYDDIQNN